jgi:undecaprenyl-diphosphatase
MTTFQAIVYAIVHGFSEFLPIGAQAHQRLLADALGWGEPPAAFQGALALGALLSVLLYFIHDWASIVSSFLQVLIFRKRPMTLDERLVFFLFISSLPAVGAWYYLKDSAPVAWTEPRWIVAGLIAFAAPLWITDRLSRRNKGMFDWNWADAAWVGIGQALMFVPGCGRTTGGLAAIGARNYHRDAGAKYVFLAAGPALAAAAFSHLRLASASGGIRAELGWMTFVVTVVVTCLAGLLAIGGLLKHVQRKGLGQYAAYRLVVGAAAAAWLWYRART